MRSAVKIALYFINSIAVFFSPPGAMSLKVTTQSRVTVREGEAFALRCDVTTTHTDATDVKWLFKENGPVCWINNLKFQACSQKYKDRYEWIGNVKSGNMSIIITNARVNDSGTYTCKVNNVMEEPSENSADVLVTVQKASILKVTTQRLVTVTEGGDFALRCDVTTIDYEATDVKWLFEKQTPVCWINNLKFQACSINYTNRYEWIGNAKSGNMSIIITNARVNDSGTYTCKVNNVMEDPSEDSADVLVTVQSSSYSLAWLLLLLLIPLAVGIAIFVWRKFSRTRHKRVSSSSNVMLQRREGNERKMEPTTDSLPVRED